MASAMVAQLVERYDHRPDFLVAPFYEQVESSR
jgi:hypothetical protein